MNTSQTILSNPTTAGHMGVYMLQYIFDKHDKVDFFCIGTPEIPGDAVGPLVGSMLQCHSFDRDVRIVGTVTNPVLASNYREQLIRLRSDVLVIVVDAFIGKSVGTYDIVEGPTRPGGALKTGIELVGDVSVKAYTGSSILQLMRAKKWDIAVMAHNITTDIIGLLKITNKNRTYI